MYIVWINSKQHYICDTFESAIEKRFEFGGEIYEKMNNKYKDRYTTTNLLDITHKGGLTERVINNNIQP